MFLGTAIVLLFVLAVLAVVGYALFELTPFAHHQDNYRDRYGHLHTEDSPHI
jgi:cytochrome c biogenesis protein ResB